MRERHTSEARLLSGRERELQTEIHHQNTKTRDDRILLADLADALADSPLDALTIDDLAAERDAVTHLERMPLPVVTNVAQSTAPPEEDD